MNLDLISHAGYNTTQPIAHPQESYLAHGTTPQASPEILTEDHVLSKYVLINSLGLCTHMNLQTCTLSIA